MTDGRGDATRGGSHQPLHKPALQIICLGGGGGPSEDNVSGLLVRSTASEWARGSLLAVDAGRHLAGIMNILEHDFPVASRAGPGDANGGLAATSTARAPLDDLQAAEPTTLTSGPFAGLRFPNATAGANALHVIRNYVSTYLITHAHLDHLSGFVINTAGFHATSRPKTVAALPGIVSAIKQHIFNDVIWPNMTDEDGGVGFVTFQRLKEGGDVMIGSGEGRGYIDVSDRLGVKAFKVSHGMCTKGSATHPHRGSIHNIPAEQLPFSAAGYTDAAPQQRNVSMPGTPGTPGASQRASFWAGTGGGGGGLPSPRLGPSFWSTSAPAGDSSCVVDSTAFFIREEETQREVLVFGDVEPDALSAAPRNHMVWQEAARRIAAGSLVGIFIECSYDDSQPDPVLFGHLCPRHLVAELQILAGLVADSAPGASGFAAAARKRKRSGLGLSSSSAGGGSFDGHGRFHLHPPHHLQTALDGAAADRKRSRSLAASRSPRRGSLSDPMTLHPSGSPPLPPPPQPSSSAARDGPGATQHELSEARAAAAGSAEPLSPTARVPATRALRSGSDVSASGAAAAAAGTDLPLAGVRVIVIHVKDSLRDGPATGDVVLAQLHDHEIRLREEGVGLGCEFVISRAGESYWF